MRTHDHPLGTVYVPDETDSLDALYRLRQGAAYWSADTETTGLNQYRADFRVRLVQVGVANEAWLLRPEWHAQAIADLTPDAWWHNAVYDALSLEQACGVDYWATMTAHRDTAILSRLIDPRPAGPGTVGHELKALGDLYVMEGVKDARREVLAEGKRLFGQKFMAAAMWREIPVDNEVYERYAGQDIFLTAGLAPALERRIAERGLGKFDTFEHQFARKVALLTRTGTAFDGAWADQAEAGYDEAFREAERELVEVWEIDQTATYAHSSKKSLIARFEALGARWVKYTDKGGVSLDASVLDTFGRTRGEVGDLARAITAAKKAKHYGDYIRGMRDSLGTDGRVHPKVNPLAAATARMSITDPPLQQLPRTETAIRGCLIADPGESILTADYAQVEFRVGAAVSGDEEMRRRIVAGEDLHAATATALYGPGFTKEQRNVAKGVGFGRLYMGGPPGIRAAIMMAYPANCPSLSAIRRAVAAFDKAYPQTVRWGKRLKARVDAGENMLTTATGRQLFVDLPHAAPNYAIQSPARDVFAAGFMALHKAGLGEYLRLVVHDEVVMSVPTDRAQDIGAEVARHMSTVFRGVPIETEFEVKGERWSK